MKTIYQLTPLTKKATLWIEENLEKNAFKNAYAVLIEHRFIQSIYEGMINEGLKNKKDFIVF